ncbi:MAG: ASCH domain-containing protein [Verrucomicrobiota bacterium]
MFQPRFADLVEAEEKGHTIRPLPKGPKYMPKVGDVISCRKWEGKPYRSKHVELLKAEVTDVFMVRVLEASVECVRGVIWDEDRQVWVPLPDCDFWRVSNLDIFAENDGFKDWADMKSWFEKTHQLPFEGVLIKWGEQIPF